MSSRPSAEPRRPGAPTGLTVDDDAAPLAVTGAPAFGWIVQRRRPQRDPARRTSSSSATRPTTGTHTRVVRQRDGREQPAVVRARARACGSRPTTATGGPCARRTPPAQFGPYAADAHFDTGLGDADWHASWIRRRDRADVVASTARRPADDFALIRKEADVGASPIVRARVYAAAGQQYELRVNGTRAAHGPSFSYPDEQYYETTDVTKLRPRGRARTRSRSSRTGRPRARAGPTRRRRSSRTSPIDHADGTPPGRSRPTARGAPTPGRGSRARPATTKATSSSTSTSGSIPSAGTGPASTTAPGRRRVVLGPHPWAPFTHLVAARTHIVEQPMKPRHAARDSRDGAYVADFGAVIAATPVVDIAPRRRGARGEARRPATCSTRTVTSRRRAVTRKPTCTGTSTNAPARRSSGRSAISASATSRSTARRSR